MSADALQVYAGLETLTGAAGPAERAQLEHRLLSFLPIDATFSAGQYAELAHAEIDGLLAAGVRPIVVGGTGLYLRAALTELSLRPAPAEGVRERWLRELEARVRSALHATLVAASSMGRGRDRSRRPPADRAGAGAARRGRARAAGGRVGAVDRRRPPPDAAHRPRDGARAALRADRRRVEEMVAAGAADEVRRANAAGASITARKALGFNELLAGDVEAMKRRTRNYARRQLTWMRKLAVGSRARRDRPRRRTRWPPRSRQLWLTGSGVNGYISTAATSDGEPPAAIALRETPLTSHEVGDDEIDPRHHDDHVVQVARPAPEQAQQLERHERSQEPGESHGRDRAGRAAPRGGSVRGSLRATPSAASTRPGSASSMIGGLIMPRKWTAGWMPVSPGAGCAGLMLRYTIGL